MWKGMHTEKRNRLYRPAHIQSEVWKHLHCTKYSNPPLFIQAYTHAERVYVFACTRTHIHTLTHTHRNTRACTPFDLHTGKHLNKHNLVFFISFLSKWGRMDVFWQSSFCKNHMSHLYCFFISVLTFEDAMLTKRLEKSRKTQECVKLEKHEN